MSEFDSKASPARDSLYNPIPQNAPGSYAAVGHTLENSIPLSIFPIAPDRLCICLCGLPARGKTRVARRLRNYLSFFHAIPVKTFHVSDYRRKMFGAVADADWFDKDNEDARIKREQCQNAAADDMEAFLTENTNGVAIYDSTNATHERRVKLVKRMHLIGTKIMWIEISNDNLEFQKELYRSTAINSPDFLGVDNVDPVEEYAKRAARYEKFFQPIDRDEYSVIESRWSYMKCDFAEKSFIIHKLKGYLHQKVVNFITNLRTKIHVFYMSRHGESEYNELGRIGGDSGLTAQGLAYARKLAEFVDQKVVRDANGNEVPGRLWTSTMRRTKETAQFIKKPTLIIPSPDDPSLKMEWVQMRPRPWHHLDELFAGACDGMTYKEIEAQYPEEWKRRAVDKLAYRYPRGESYFDVIARLEPIIIEMERHEEPLLIIAHQGILRIIYAFYMGLSRAEAPYVSIPLNTVVQLRPIAYGCDEERYLLYKPGAIHPDGQNEPQGNMKIKIHDPPSH